MSSICSPAPPGWGQRHTVAFLGFWYSALSYALRFNLSIAIVAMVNDTSPVSPPKVLELNSPTHGNFSSVSVVQFEEACAHLKAPSATPGQMADSQGEFHWNRVEQGMILGSFFWGYVLTQLPGGILATKYGGKWTLGCGLLTDSIFAILTPMLARTHISLLICARVIQGMGDGVTIPAMHAILAAWCPPHERSFLGMAVYAGCQFGTAITMVVSGYLIHAGILGGWPSVFYFFGGFGICWFIMWCLLIHDTPATHPKISGEELLYIQNSIGNSSRHAAGGHGRGGPVPWLEIFKSGPMWAIISAHVGYCYGLYTLLTLLPTYLKTVLHFDIKENSWLTALPFIVMWVVAVGATRLADIIISKKILKPVIVRKSCQAIGHIGAACALIGASYSGCDRGLTVGLLTLAVGINGSVFGSFIVNHIDISPNYAGILVGITSTIANLTGFAAPYIAGLLINENPSIQNWQLVFLIASGIYVADVIIYSLFASTTEQPWNRPKEHQNGITLQ